MTRDDDTRDRELREELEFHLGEDQAELESSGRDAAEARRDARLAFGNPAVIQDDVRDVWVARWMRELRQDVRFGVRSLRRSPAFLTAAILCLALGIGATTTVLSVANAVIVRGLPYPDADRLLVLYEQRPREGVSDNVVSYADFFDWREQNRTFEAIGAWEGATFAFAGGGEAQRVWGALVTAGFFDALAVVPREGRLFTPDDEETSAPRAVIVTDAFWRRSLGADAAAVGRVVALDGRPHTVIGILPAGFEAPFYQWEMFVPFRFDAAARASRGNHTLRVLARLQRDSTLEQARADMDRLSLALEREHPVNQGHYANVVPMTDALRGELRPAAMALVVAAAFVMLIACFNVASLLLARAMARDREMAVRVALGAGWGRLLRQLLAEGLLLSLAGTAAGLVIAALAVPFVRYVLPAYRTLNPDGIRVDLTVLSLTLAAALVTGVLFGVAPALGYGRRSLAGGVRAGGDLPSTAMGGAWLRSAIIIAQTALAVTLLVGAGLLLRSFWTLQSVDPGFRAERVIALQLRLPSAYSTPQQIRAFQADLVSRVRALPGVASAGMTSFLPMAGEDSRQGLVIEGITPDPALGPRRANWRVVTPGYMETLRIPLIEGRLFDDRDGDGAPLVMLVNEAAARRHWPDGRPVGSRARLSSGMPDFATVVGVVGDVRHEGPEQDAVPEAYFASAQFPFGVMSLVVRTESDPEALMPVVRAVLREIDSTLAPVALRHMETVIEQTYASRRFLTFLVLGFAALALVLAMCGVYAQLAYAVSRRTHDLGVRMALGAHRAQVVGMVMRQGLRLALLGSIVGLVAALGLSRTLQQFLFGIDALDLRTLAAVPVVLLLTAAVACAIPAARAARVSPAVALRHE